MTQKMKSIRQAVLLAGGMGTRIRPVLGGVPKLLAPLGQQSYLDWQLDYLGREGFISILLCLGHGAERIIKHLSRLYSDKDVSFIVEETPLGTGGALRNALNLLDDAFVLMNGDTILKGSLEPLMNPQSGGELDNAAILLAHVPDAGAYGVVEVDSRGLVTSFREKGISSGPGLVSAGAYRIPRHLVETISAGPCSLEQDVLPDWVAAGLLRGVVIQEGFIDIGTPQGYQRASLSMGSLS